MKRKATLLLLCVLLLCCSAFFISCGKHAHRFTNYVSNNDATCTEDGTKTAKCNGCEETNTITDPGTAKGHDFSAEWTIDKEATCTEAGSKSRHCTRCGAKTDETEIPSMGHDDVNGVCTVCGAFIQYTATFKADGAVVGTVKFTVEDENITEPAVPEKTGYIGVWEDYPLAAADITVNAVYTKYYGLTFDYNGATGGNGTMNKMIFRGEAVGELPTPTKKDDYYDYWFAGWKVGSVTITENTIWNEESDATATACWEKASKGLRYDLNGDGKSYTVFKGNCTDTEVIIPAVYNVLPVTSIGKSAFYNYGSLTGVVIPGSVTSIGDVAFARCDNLKKVNYRGTIEQWAEIDFYDLSSNPTYRTNNLYINDKLVTEANLTTVTRISDYAFFGCFDLFSVTIGSNVTSIGKEAFSCCSRLVEVINNSSLNIKKKSSENGCVAEFALDVKNGGTSEIVNENGYVFYRSTDFRITFYLVGYIGTDTELTLPDDYHENRYEINKYAFVGRDDLTSVTVPNGVSVIGSAAFLHCSGLTSVTFISGSDATVIDSSAFANCTSLTNLSFGNSVCYIGIGSFSGCTGLTDITIPSEVTWVGSFAFSDCTNLKNINYLGLKWNWKSLKKDTDWNNNVPSDCVVHCTDGDLSL